MRFFCNLASPPLLHSHILSPPWPQPLLTPNSYFHQLPFSRVEYASAWFNYSKTLSVFDYPPLGFPCGSEGKESAFQWRRPRFDPCWEDPQRREWLPTPVFLPGEFCGQRSLEGYSPWRCKELDTTERLTHTHIHTFVSTRPLFQHYFPSRDQLFEF